jgi:DNA-binding MarR family transcriptional regulator
MHRSRRARALARPIDYETLAELRYQVRRFLRVRELASRASGVAPQQYLVLLQIRGVAARQPVTIGLLAERLQIHHHSAVQLVDRLSGQGLVERRRDGRDRRSVIVELRPRGEALLRRLALYSMAELKTEGPALASSLRRLVMNASRRSREFGHGHRPRIR